MRHVTAAGLACALAMGFVSLAACSRDGEAEEPDSARDREGWIADTQYAVDSSGARLEIIIGRPPGAIREVVPRAGSGDPKAPGAFRILEPSVVRTMMQAAGRPGWFVIDLRHPERYVSEGHIAGAALIPFDVLEENLTDLHVRSDQMVLVYAESTPTAWQAAWTLAEYGFPNIRVLAGGFPAWKAGGFPVETTP